MNKLALIKRVRNHTRDLSATIFRQEDIYEYFDEAVDRIAQVVPELQNMPYVVNNEEEPSLLPRQYHHLLATYAVGRAFGQDERHYQATTYMNEFEQKLDELRQNVENGIVKILDSTGNPVVVDSGEDYVVDNYFENESEITELPFDEIPDE